MTPKERKRLNTLCKQIKDERDPRVFSILLKELDELLDATCHCHLLCPQSRRESSVRK